ncbi:MAG TPA: type II secretion system protein [bacterium]|nr:type II secretion system protein [bacterium]
MMKKQTGFTILEVMLVVILISILAAIVIPRFSVSAKRAKVQSCEMNRSIINKQVEAYFFMEATWPTDSLDDIKTNDNYFPDGIPTCPVDFTSYVLVPSPKHRISGHREGDGTHVF